MSKKLVCLGMALVMLFSLAGLSACDLGNDLAGYKTAAKAGLETYAQEKGEGNYTAENWTVIGGLVTEGKTAVDEAASTTAVDTAVETAEQSINDVPQKEDEEDFEMVEILKHFDLTDPTDYWDGTVDDLLCGGSLNAPAWDDMVKIIFCKTSTYPLLELKDFKLENAKAINYNPYHDIAPLPDDYFWEAWKQYFDIEDYRQIAVITLKEPGHDKVLEAIKHLQTLKFIKRAEPDFPNVSGC